MIASVPPLCRVAPPPPLAPERWAHRRALALENLARANQIRVSRATWRRRAQALRTPESLWAGAGLIVEQPAWARTWRVVQILRCLRGLGPHHARRALHVAGAGERASLGDLSDEQRRRLWCWLAERMVHAQDRAAAERRGQPAHEMDRGEVTGGLSGV